VTVRVFLFVAHSSSSSELRSMESANEELRKARGNKGALVGDDDMLMCFLILQ
jgi:hypothetical protein